jgi:hypothetical protein
MLLPTFAPGWDLERYVRGCMAGFTGRKAEPFAKGVVRGLLMLLMGLGGVKGLVRVGARMNVGACTETFDLGGAIREGEGDDTGWGMNDGVAPPLLEGGVTNEA